MTTEAGRGAGASIPISLVIPVRDEETSIGALLATIEAQTAQPDEVVFVDGGSSDRTVEILRAHAAKDSRCTVVEAAGGATPGRGRNLGVAAARNDWVAMTDAGIRLEPTWLERLWAAHLAEPTAEVVYGNYEFDLRSFFEECAAVAYGPPKWETPAGRSRGPTVVSCLVHRRAYQAVGGFVDLRAGEDEMFLTALDGAGIRPAWAPGATVWWRLRPDLRSNFERFRSYSYSYAMAGRQRHWQYRMVRGYVPVAVGLVLAGAHSRRWLLLPVATVGSRVGRRVASHRPDMDELRVPTPARLALIAALLLGNDAAAALGWWQATAAKRAAARA
jgi:glycosyltransferase involved in cell wall biosynthesis